MWKKFFVLLILFSNVFTSLLFSNETLNKLKNKIDFLELNKGDVISYNLSKSKKSIRLSNENIDSVYAEFDKWFCFSEVCNENQISSLKNALFQNICYGKKDINLRWIVIHDFYENGEDLIFLVKKIGLEESQKNQKNEAFLFITNCLNYKVTVNEKLHFVSADDLDEKINVSYLLFLTAEGFKSCLEN
jgi:hypothetical protein